MREEDRELRVHDRVALDEIELYADLLTAAAAADGPMTAAEIDRALGVRPGPPQAGPPAVALRRAAGSAEPPPGESRPPSPQDTPVSPAEVYRQARQQTAAEQAPLDMRVGLDRLNRWMNQEPDNDLA
ncbi:hypothetical protein [Thermomonospora umbrina]|uniref:Uncharacterized protein n=1 Tax=Thermomonospora umbrina TaxID=111806 RepID=A0A3D9T342_9ACTN|nr:hypothetical protein [Thermomonospora umbrina]REF00794.1 hypothetical protein DFJ69_6375 [Thermomonospora umbrina]